MLAENGSRLVVGSDLEAVVSRDRSNIGLMSAVLVIKTIKNDNLPLIDDFKHCTWDLVVIIRTGRLKPALWRRRELSRLRQI